MKAAACSLSITPKWPWVGASQGEGQIQCPGKLGGREDSRRMGIQACCIHSHPILSYSLLNKELRVPSWVGKGHMLGIVSGSSWDCLSRHHYPCGHNTMIPAIFFPWYGVSAPETPGEFPGETEAVWGWAEIANPHVSVCLGNPNKAPQTGC